MIRIMLTATGLLAASPACAQAVLLTPLADARLRWEHVKQDGLPIETSDAVVLRVRAGLQAKHGGLSALVEGQGNLALVGDYYDGLHGAATRPIVSDPQNIALYRAQIGYRTGTLNLTAGRQRIALDDERFVGAAAFRINSQTFDAVRTEWTPIKGMKADLTYAWALRTIWGIDGAGVRQQAVDGNNVFANLSYASPLGTLTGFAYLVDQDEAEVQGYRLSSQTYGVRLAGTRKIAAKASIAYQLSYARQSDYNRNPNDYAASYYIADATLDLSGVKLNGGYEVLGADRGVALTSVQTPLASLLKFHGWTDRFLTTPPNGLRDAYAGAGYGWTKLGRIDALSVQANYHRFDSDRLDQHYGDGWNLLATAKLKRYTVSARYAHYNADAFATDTRKAWLQLDWVY